MTTREELERKVAEILGVPVEQITFTWRQGQYDTKLSMLEANGMRPTKATWEKLIAAGVPIWSYVLDD